MTTTLLNPAGVPFLRADAHGFDDLADFPWPAKSIEYEGLRLSYVDAGPHDGPVALLMHGMPTWSYLNRHIISRLVAAGYRCIAADHIGFGRSDKVVDDSWYSIKRHIAAHAELVTQLNLKAITLFSQDWGGPIGLALVTAFPERFERLVIMNTWLHHAEYDYTPALIQWNQQWKPEGLFGSNVPDRLTLGWLMMLATERITRPELFALIGQGVHPELSPADAAVQWAYDAPFNGVGAAGHAGPRRFPLSLPFDNPIGGDAAGQAHCFETLCGWTKPIHFIWGGRDEVFTEAWGRAWSARFPQATFDLFADAGHFLQDTHGDQIAECFLDHARD